jgi:hypothetical protein
MEPRSDLQRLLAYNIDVLSQALDVIDAHAAAPHVDFAAYSGPHLRHIIEHYQAFLGHVHQRSVDYDSRARDQRLQTDPVAARECLIDLQRRLDSLDVERLRDPLAVHLRGGAAGEDNFVTFSTAGRELLFIASHAIHHYAMIKLHCAQAGIALAADFGKAPSTLRHERGD